MDDGNGRFAMSRKRKRGNHVDPAAGSDYSSDADDGGSGTPAQPPTKKRAAPEHGILRRAAAAAAAATTTTKKTRNVQFETPLVTAEHGYAYDLVVYRAAYMDTWVERPARLAKRAAWRAWLRRMGWPAIMAAKVLSGVGVDADDDDDCLDDAAIISDELPDIAMQCDEDAAFLTDAAAAAVTREKDDDDDDDSDLITEESFEMVGWSLSAVANVL